MMHTYVRVRDSDTGHEFDIVEGHPLIGRTLEPVPGVKPTRSPRPTKHAAPSGAADSVPDPAGPDDSPTPPAGLTTTTEEESHRG